MPSPRFSAVVAIGFWMLTGPMVSLAEPAGSEPTATKTDSEAADARARAGNWVHVDPQTGQRIPPPARSAAVPLDAALSSSQSGLVEEAAPGGGMMIDLQGRFRSAATATVGADGKPHVDCVAPGAQAGKE